MKYWPLWLVCLSGTASATVPDLYGIGARWQGAGSGGVAVVEDGTSAMVNPAGLARVRRPTAAAGISLATYSFDPVPDLWWDTNRDGSLDRNDPPLEYSADVANNLGAQIQIARQVGGKFGVGLTAYVPQDTLIRFATFEPSLPTYFQYENRPRRFVAAAGIGGEVLPGLSLGASVDLLAKAKLDVSMGVGANLVGPGDDSAFLEDLVDEIEIDVHKIDVRVVPAYAPVLGLQFDFGRVSPALDGLVFGAAYHGSVGLDIETTIDIQADVDISDVGELDPYTTAIILASDLQLFDHYVPPRINVGLAYRRADTFSWYGDLRVTDWRKFNLNIAQVANVAITAPFVDIDDNVVDGNQVSFLMRSTLGMRTGAELKLPPIQLENRLRYVRAAVRGGYGYEPTPLVDQTWQSALLDADRMHFSLGAGVEVWDPFALVDGPVRVDIFAQYHTLARTTLPRASDGPLAGFPVEATEIPVGGNITVVGAQFGFDY